MVDATAAERGHATYWGYAVIAGAVGYLARALADAVATAPVSAPVASVLATVAALLLVAGPVALDRAGLAGRGRTARAGAVVAAIGWVLIALADTVAATVGAEATALYVTGTGAIFLGMLVVGGAVLRARVWSGPGRWTPLLCALYVLPAGAFFGRDDVLGALAVAGWMLPWLALGIALLLRSRGA